MSSGMMIPPTPRRNAMRLFSRVVSLVALVGTVMPAQAATELFLDGYFRVRGRLYDNLQLQRPDTTTSEDSTTEVTSGTYTYLEQRLRIEPELRVNQYVSVFAQIDVLPDLIWGTNPTRLAGLDGYYDPIGQSQGFDIGDASTLLVPRRAWAELYTPFGRLKLGRTGMQVGAGVFFNDGNGMDSDYGDTADRIQLLTKVGPVFLLAGFDAIYEGSLDRSYDATGIAAAVAYKSETLSTSLYGYLQNDRSWIDETQVDASTSTQSTMSVFNVDLWGKASVGPLDLELEAIYRYGSGRVVLESTEEGVDPRTLEGATVNQFGGMARGIYAMGPWGFGAEVGLASGDPDVVGTSSETSSQLTRFSFDRDYHIGYLLFRVPLPTRLSASTDESFDARYDEAIVGNAISNAFYLAPAVEFRVLDNLSAKVTGVAAWALETNSLYNQQKDYGYELDLEVKSKLYDRINLSAKGAMLIPGRVFEPNQELSFGGELNATIEF